MHANALLSLVSVLALTVSAAPVAKAEVAAPVDKRTGACSSYTIINTRGTGEPQGPSLGFTAINRLLTAEVPGGKVYNTVYLADASQNSALGTADIINKISSTLRENPNECFLLQGYSQGAAATVNAMSRITGPSFDAVKGAFLIGNPHHRAGLACNVDIYGGATTRNVNGLSVALGPIPQNWVSKTLDVCAFVSCAFVLSIVFLPSPPFYLLPKTLN